MRWLLPELFAAMLTPLTAAQHDRETLMAYEERKNDAYQVLRLITQEMELTPTESWDQCEAIGSEIMKGGKLSKYLKGYNCVPGLLSAKRIQIANHPRLIPIP